MAGGVLRAAWRRAGTGSNPLIPLDMREHLPRSGVEPQQSRLPAGLVERVRSRCGRIAAAGV